MCQYSIQNSIFTISCCTHDAILKALYDICIESNVVYRKLFLLENLLIIHSLK